MHGDMQGSEVVQRRVRTLEAGRAVNAMDARLVLF